MAHIHEVYDMESHFEINGSSRFIRETSDTKLVVVQGDHNSEVVTFKMARYIDGHDMLLCNRIRVHYINTETDTNNQSVDIYEVTDLALCEGNDDELAFTWMIEAPATKYQGQLAFVVKFECIEGDEIVYQWNTAKNISINVLAGINNDDEFIEKYSNTFKKIVDEFLESNGLGAKISEVTLLASNWVGSESPYSQIVTIDGVTKNSQVDLTPSVEQLEIFHEKDLAFVTENENGVVTVYAIGQKPANDYTIQVTITEVLYE